MFSRPITDIIHSRLSGRKKRRIIKRLKHYASNPDTCLWGLRTGGLRGCHIFTETKEGSGYWYNITRIVEDHKPAHYPNRGNV